MEEGRNPVPPGGQHFGRRRTTSSYNAQLREKQKAKRIYGVSERQFKNYYLMAIRKKGVTGDTLIELLERRLDNVVYRMGFGLSRSEARQIVRHNHVYVNSRRVNIPSFLVSKDDVIQVKAAKDAALGRVRDNIEITKDRGFPEWLAIDKSTLSARVVRLPEKEDIQQPIQEQLIVELYSK